MPAWRPAGDIGVKIVTVFPDNADRGTAVVNAEKQLCTPRSARESVTFSRFASSSRIAFSFFGEPHRDELHRPARSGFLVRHQSPPSDRMAQL